MSRDLSPVVAAAVIAPSVQLALLAEFDFAGGPVRFWTGYGQQTWNGVVWTGSGELGGVSPISETTTVGAASMSFTLSGVPSDIIALALGDAYRGKACKLYLAIVDSNAIIQDAYQVFGGRMDIMKIADTGPTCTITLNVENQLLDMGRARDLRYTDEEQQRLFPGDRGLEYVAKLSEKPIYWGIATPATGTGATTATQPSGAHA
jgi:hypothetical protein